MITAYASLPHYWRHLAPVVEELRSRGHEVETFSLRAGQPWGARAGRATTTGDALLVASWIDARAWPRSRVVYLEHGAGQTYRDGSGHCYAGAPGLEHVILFLGPGEHVAEKWRARYPATPVEAVGCPALDGHDRYGLRVASCGASGSDGRPVGRAPVVAFTAHWKCGVCPETKPALPEFERGIRELARLEAVEPLGHCHPRAARIQQIFCDRLGVELDLDPDSVLRRADVIVADNTSFMYEAAAVGIPVVALNSPTYRRDVEHGLRFWSHVPGLQCDNVGTFIPAIFAALDDPPEARALRRRAVTHVYAHRDGRSAARAADAIERVT